MNHIYGLDIETLGLPGQVKGHFGPLEAYGQLNPDIFQKYNY